MPAPPPPGLDEQRADLAPRLRAQWAVGGHVGRARGDEPDRPPALGGHEHRPGLHGRDPGLPGLGPGQVLDRGGGDEIGVRGRPGGGLDAGDLLDVGGDGRADCGEGHAYGYRIPGDRIRWPWKLVGVTSTSRLPWIALGVVYVLWGSHLPGQPLRAPVRATAARGRVPVPGRRRAAGPWSCSASPGGPRPVDAPRSSAPPCFRASCCPRGATAWSWSPSRGWLSGLAALLIAAVPLWIVLLRVADRRPPADGDDRGRGGVGVVGPRGAGVRRASGFSGGVQGGPRGGDRGWCCWPAWAGPPGPSRPPACRCRPTRSRWPPCRC